MLNRSILAAALAIALPASAFAHNHTSDLSYSYVEAGFLHDRTDDFSANGYALNGSVEIGDTGLYGTATWATADTNVASIDVDVERYTLGAGYAFKVKDNLHVLAEASYVLFNANGAGVSEDSDGYQAFVGLRGVPADKWELLGKVGYLSVEDSGLEVYDEAIGHLEARYRIDGMWSTGLQAQIIEDEQVYQFTLRASF